MRAKWADRTGVPSNAIHSDKFFAGIKVQPCPSEIIIYKMMFAFSLKFVHLFLSQKKGILKKALKLCVVILSYTHDTVVVHWISFHTLIKGDTTCNKVVWMSHIAYKVVSIFLCICHRYPCCKLALLAFVGVDCEDYHQGIRGWRGGHDPDAAHCARHVSAPVWGHL